MNIVIYGKKTGCGFCDRAVMLCEIKGLKYEFIETTATTLKELSETVGVPLTTVPQIYVDGVHVGGYNSFRALMYSKDKNAKVS